MKKNKLFVGIITSFALGLLVTGCNQGGGTTNVGDSYVTGVTLDFEQYNFENSGDQVTFHATVTIKEGKEYTGGIAWRSSAPTIASVNQEGVVTAAAGGECYITAIAGYKAASCKVTVPQKGEPAGELTFSISYSDISLKPNSNFQLNCYMNGEDVTSGSTWTSLDENIASVNAGLVTGLNEGSTTIKAVFSTKEVTCLVTVSESAVVEFSIRLDKNSLNLLVGANATLNAITSEQAEVTWTSSDSLIASVNNGVVTANKAGTCVITATANNKSATCNVTVSDPSGEEEDEDKCVLVRFYIDYNNVDPSDETKTKKLAEFMWYQNMPLKNAPELPMNPTTAMDPAFPYFVGWSTHTLIDSKADLWNMDTDCVDGTVYTLTLYGIWSDVEDFSL